MEAQLLDLVPPGGGEAAGEAEDDDFTITECVPPAIITRAFWLLRAPPCLTAACARSGGGSNPEDGQFDRIVGLLEDIMMGARRQPAPLARLRSPL